MSDSTTLDIGSARAADVISAPVPVVLDLAAEALVAEGLTIQVETAEALAERLRQLGTVLLLVSNEIATIVEDEETGELALVERFRLERWAQLLGGAK